MTRKGRANGSLFGNDIYKNLLARRSHLFCELSYVVEQARPQGFISVRLHILDATHMAVFWEMSLCLTAGTLIKN